MRIPESTSGIASLFAIHLEGAKGLDDVHAVEAFQLLSFEPAALLDDMSSALAAWTWGFRV